MAGERLNSWKHNHYSYSVDVAVSIRQYNTVRTVNVLIADYHEGARRSCKMKTDSSHHEGATRSCKMKTDSSHHEGARRSCKMKTDSSHSKLITEFVLFHSVQLTYLLLNSSSRHIHSLHTTSILVCAAAAGITVSADRPLPTEMTQMLLISRQRVNGS